MLDLDAPMGPKERAIWAMSRVRSVATTLDHIDDDSTFINHSPNPDTIKFGLAGAEYAVCQLRHIRQMLFEGIEFAQKLPVDFRLRRETIKRLRYAAEVHGQMDVPASSAVYTKDFEAATRIALDTASKMQSQCGKALTDLYLELSVDIDDMPEERKW